MPPEITVEQFKALERRVARIERRLSPEEKSRLQKLLDRAYEERGYWILKDYCEYVGQCYNVVLRRVPRYRDGSPRVVAGRALVLHPSSNGREHRIALGQEGVHHAG